MGILLTREPVFYSRGGLYAYYIKYRHIESAIVNSKEFFGFDLNKVCGEVKAFVGFSRDMINEGAPLEFPADSLVCVISAREISGDRKAVEICRSLKRRGYSFAINDFKRGRGFDEILDLCDVVMLDFSSLHSVQDDASYICGFTNKRIFAENITDRENSEIAKRMGCSYVHGGFFLIPQRDLRNIKPLPISIVKAMKIMMKPEPNVDEIVDVLSQDTAVCQKILRLINSAYFGVTNKISTISQAIIVLGLDYLREWIYMLAIQHISQNENEELMKLSLVTAKFCRKLAGEIPSAGESADAFYLMGLMSILVYGKDRNLLAVLAELPLTDEIKDGILRKSGIYGDVFGMAVDYAMGNWESFEEIAGKHGIDLDKASKMFSESLEEADKTDFE